MLALLDLLEDFREGFLEDVTLELCSEAMKNIKRQKRGM